MEVRELMTREVAVVSPDTSLRDAARKMDWLNVGALPVCDGGRLVGIVTDRDITVRATALGAPPEYTCVYEVMSENPRWCFEDDAVQVAEREMARLQVRRMPVVNRREELVGMIALGDLAAERVPGIERTLRRISHPAEPDWSWVGVGEKVREGHLPAARQSHRRSPPEFAEAGFDRPRYRPKDRDETGLGASGMDYEERYQLAPDDEGQARVEGRHYGRVGRERRSYVRGYPDDHNRGYDEYWRPGEVDRPVFDRAEEETLVGMTHTYRGRGPRGYRRSDQRIQEDVSDRFMADNELDASEVEVSVKDGEVTLSGKVDTRADKRRAEDIAEAVSGVTYVQNNLRVVETRATA